MDTNELMDAAAKESKQKRMSRNMGSPRPELSRRPSAVLSSAAEAAQAESDQHFHRLCQMGRLKEVRQTLEQGGDHIAGLLQRRVGVYGYTPMHEAASYGHDEILSHLLLFGGDPNALANSDYTPLHLAAASGRAQCVKVLLHLVHKADLSLVDSYGRTALHTAELGGKKEVIRLLKSAEVVRAASDDSPQLGPMLQGLQADQVEKNTFDRALMECAGKGYLDAAAKLVIKGALNYDKCATKAIEQGHYEVAALLSLCAAAGTGDICSLRAFLRRGDDFSAINTEITRRGRSSSPSAVPLAVKEPHLSKIRQVLCDGVVNKTVAVVTIALRAKQKEAALELLLHLDCNQRSGQVDWHGLALRSLEPSWLTHISGWVVRFLLASNALTKVPKELADCKRLERLDLCRNALQTIPHEVVQLPVLRNLNLSHNQLHHLPECPWSSTLGSLNVGNNDLCSLPAGLKHTKLTNLILKHNSFTEVPPAVCSLVNLTCLDLSDNPKILTLPNSMGRLKDLMQLNLSGNEISDPPVNYLKPAQKCIRYLAQRLRGCMPYYRMKLMVVGLAGRGKSTLVARFLGNDIGNLSTVGIDLSVWHYKKAIFNIWDFAGQEQYYATHQCFMTNRAIYLLLWNIMDDEKGINELRPWLDNIVARAPKSPVLIVATHRDKLTPQMLEDNYMEKMLEKVEQLTFEPQYRKRLHVSCITAVSCSKGSLNIDGLKAMVYEAAEQFEYRKDRKVMGESVPASYHKLDQLVHQRSEEMAKSKLPPILREKEVCTLMRKKGISDIDNEEELQLAAEFLHEVGSMLHYPDRNTGLADLYFIDPRWLCDMMAVVVTIRERNPYIRGGVLSRSNVPMLFRDKRFPTDLFDQYLSLLNRFEIALSMDNDHILIPSLLPEEPPSDVPDFNSSWSTVPVIRRHHRMIGVPAGFWSRLIARLLQQLQEVLGGLGILSSDWLGTGHLVASSPDGRPHHQPSQRTAFAKVMEHGKSSIHYWRRGLCFQHPKLFFMLRPLILLENSMYAGGVETMTSLGCNGRHLMGLIVDEIHKLINEWYPGLKDEDFSGDSMQVVVPCTRCTQLGHPQPFIFDFETCAAALVDGHVKCPSHPDQLSPLADLTPELLLLDLPQRFVLSNDEVECCKDEDNKLGEGGFGIVYRGQVRDKKVAVKTYATLPQTRPADMLKELRQEVNILKRIAHPYLVGMVGVVLEAQPLQLVLELAPLGSLCDLVVKQQKQLPRMLMHNSAAQVAMALAYLHAQNIVFRDLKSANVLLFSTDVRSDVNVKLTDYGIASVLTPSGIKGFEGTMGFQAPEILQFQGTEEYSSKVDIYSFAIFLYELLTGQVPFWEFPPSVIADAVRSGKRPRLEGVEATQCGLPCWTGLMKQCWRNKGEERPTAQQAAHCLLDPYAQSFLGSLDVLSSRSVRQAVYVQQTDEVWICCDDADATDVIVVNAKTMTMSRSFTISQHQVRAMIVVDGHMVWLGLRSGLGPGMVCVYDATIVRSGSTPLLTRKLDQPIEALLYCPLPGEEYVLASTSDGYLNNMQAHVRRSVLPTMLRKKATLQKLKVGQHHVRSMVLVGKQIWCALMWFIHIFNCDNLSAQSESHWKASPIDGRQIDCLRVNSDNSIVWSNVFDHWIVCGWRVKRAETCHCVINVKDSLKQVMASPSKQSVSDPIVTAMETSLDTLLLGLASGHLLIFNEADGMLLSWMKPYTEWVRLLVRCGSPGPFGLEKSVILSGGKGFCAPLLAQGEALSPEQETDIHQKGVNPPLGGTAVLFEVFTADDSELLQKRSEGLADHTLEKYTQAQLLAPSSPDGDGVTDIEWDVTGCDKPPPPPPVKPRKGVYCSGGPSSDQEMCRHI